MLTPHTIIPGLEVPNLDDLSPDDLDAACDAFRALEHLAYAIRDARRLRLAGAVHEAKHYEKRVDDLYSALPQSMRY